MNDDGAAAYVAAARALQAEIVRLASDLIALPTPNPPGSGYVQCVEYLEAELKAAGLAPQVVLHPTDATTSRYSLIVALGEGEPTLHFHGHYDTVPFGGDSGPHPAIEAGRLFGRGSSDMKGGLASMLGAVLILQRLGLPRRGRVLVSLVPDEETGGKLGTEFLWTSGHLQPGGVGMLMPEPTSGTVWNANRGALSATITVRGRPAHVGLAHAGLNAFRGMTLAAQGLFRLQSEVAKRRTALPVDPPEADASVMLVGGRCSGGTNFNLVPEECTFTVDRRTNPEERLPETRTEIENAVMTALEGEDFDLSFNYFQEGEASAIPADTPVGIALGRAVGAVTGVSPGYAMCPGLCEIRFFNRHGVPAYAYGPGILAASHGPREYVEVERLVECAAIYASVAADVLG